MVTTAKKRAGRAPPRVVVSPNEPFPPVTAALLKRLAWAKARKAELQRECDNLAKEIDPAEDCVMAWLEELGVDSHCEFGFTVAQVFGPRYPKWKDHFISAMGKKAADDVFANTVQSVRLSLTEVGTKPKPKPEAAEAEFPPDLVSTEKF